jgi:hypothetical protein
MPHPSSRLGDGLPCPFNSAVVAQGEGDGGFVQPAHNRPVCIQGDLAASEGF